MHCFRGITQWLWYLFIKCLALWCGGEYHSTLSYLSPELWLGTAETGNTPTSEVTRQEPGIRTDYDLKLCSLWKRNGQLGHSTSLALAPSSGKASEKQAFRESHAEGCWHLECRFWDNSAKSARVYTLRVVATQRDADDQVGLWLIRFLQEITFPFLWPGMTPAPPALPLGAGGFWAAACGQLVCVVESSWLQSGRGCGGHQATGLGSKSKEAELWPVDSEEANMDRKRVWPKRQWHSPSPLVPKWRLSKGVETSTRRWLYLLGFYEAGAWSQRFCVYKVTVKTFL